MRWDGGCAGDGIITVYERAMAQVWLRLEAIAQQHGVADALQALLRVRSALHLPFLCQTYKKAFCREGSTHPGRAQAGGSIALGSLCIILRTLKWCF